MAAPWIRLAAGGNTAANLSAQATAAPDGDVDMLAAPTCYLVLATERMALKIWAAQRVYFSSPVSIFR